MPRCLGQNCSQVSARHLNSFSSRMRLMEAAAAALQTAATVPKAFLRPIISPRSYSPGVLSGRAVSDFSLPSVLTPGGDSNLATSLNYATSFATASATGPNGATATYTYDSFGRVSTSTIPD